MCRNITNNSNQFIKFLVYVRCDAIYFMIININFKSSIFKYPMSYKLYFIISYSTTEKRWMAWIGDVILGRK